HCYLIEQRLEEVVICTVDERDARGSVLEGLGCCEPAETATDYQNMRPITHINSFLNHEEHEEHEDFLKYLFVIFVIFVVNPSSSRRIYRPFCSPIEYR